MNELKKGYSRMKEFPDFLISRNHTHIDFGPLTGKVPNLLPAFLARHRK